MKMLIRFCTLAVLALFIVLHPAQSTPAQAKFGHVPSLVTVQDNAVTVLGAVTNHSFHTIHHTPEQWRRHLERKRAKRRAARKYRKTRSRKARKSQTRKQRLSKKRRLARAKARKARADAKAAAKRKALLAKTEVAFKSTEKPGTVIVDTKAKRLFYVLNNKRAIRYAVAVGKQGFAWSGKARVRRKVEWPTWTPPASMIKRKPHLAKWSDGQPGGPNNPLGAAALYLFQGKKDTLYRIHGTNNPASIGTASSSGCIRMRNEDIQDLYAKVSMGAKVIVR
ncbi:MAG: L,D-transpeptidase [Pseudomonadota bacterium]